MNFLHSRCDLIFVKPRPHPLHRVELRIDGRIDGLAHQRQLARRFHLPHRADGWRDVEHIRRRHRVLQPLAPILQVRIAFLLLAGEQRVEIRVSFRQLFELRAQIRKRLARPQIPFSRGYRDRPAPSSALPIFPGRNRAPEDRESRARPRPSCPPADRESAAPRRQAHRRPSSNRNSSPEKTARIPRDPRGPYSQIRPPAHPPAQPASPAAPHTPRSPAGTAPWPRPRSAAAPPQSTRRSTATTPHPLSSFHVHHSSRSKRRPPLLRAPVGPAL